MKPLIGSPGGKNYLKKKIIPLIPEHRIYCEPYVGGGSVYFAKKPSEIEVLNDLDKDIIFLYKFIKSAPLETLEKLKNREWRANKELWERLKNLKPKTAAERFYRNLYVTRWSYGCLLYTSPSPRD